MSIRAVIATRLYPPEVGAAAFRLRALANALKRSGADVTVMTSVPPSKYAKEQGVLRWPVLRDRGGNVRGYVQYLSFDLPLFFRLIFTSADIVVCEPPPTTGLVVAISSWIRKRPYVYYAADIWTDAVIAMGAAAPVVSIIRRVEGFALRNAAHVLAVSGGVAQQLPQFEVSPQRVTIVGNGIDTDIFSPVGPKEQPGHAYFVYTGTMSEWQGAEIFIKALEMLGEDDEDVPIYFLGQGTSESNLRALAESAVPGRVEFLGVRSPVETASWIRGAAGALVSIVPERGYDFAKPTKIYAAAACGTPVIYAGVGESATMVSDNALGESVDYDARKVADAMHRLLNADDGSRAQRAGWVSNNASLRLAGERAADAVVLAARVQRP